MSHTSLIFALPGAASSVGIGAAAAAAGAGLAVGVASYYAVQQLRKDYQEALCAFQAREQAHHLALAVTEQMQHEQNAEAAAITAETTARTAEDATDIFLRQAMARLQTDLDNLPKPDPTLSAHCHLLLAEIAAHPEQFEEHYRQYQELLHTLHAIQKQTQHPREVALEELAALRAELDSPLLAAAAPTAKRRELLQQLDSLEVLVQSQSSVVEQGIHLFRARVQREVLDAVRMRDAREQSTQEMRALVGEILAKVTALSQTSLADYPARADVLRARLMAIITATEADNLTALQALGAEVSAEYTASERLLTESANADYLGSQVSDVLLGMGYRVTEIPAEGDAAAATYVAELEHGVGFQFQVNGEGRMGTEMVAFSEETAVMDVANQEHVCQVIDKVLAELRRRDFTVKERFRRTMEEGHALTVIEPDADVAHPHLHAAAPKHRKVTGS